ncbi:hypothetical protein [Amycolatopsis circi]|nr:hypothetical protein [Amycolatopsis circi]
MVALLGVGTMAAVFLPVAADAADDGQRRRSPDRPGSLVRRSFRCW